MTEEKKLQRMIEKDLEEYERVWKQFSYDVDEMETLFRMLISHYIHKINGFAEDIEVICDYEKAGEKIEVYRKNISLLVERIKLFLDRKELYEAKLYIMLELGNFKDTTPYTCKNTIYDNYDYFCKNCSNYNCRQNKKNENS